MTAVTNPRATTDRTRHGAHETNGLVNGSAYHAEVDYTRRPLTLKEVREAGGRITRLRLLTERTYGGTFCDVSYIHATLPGGETVPVQNHLNNLTPLRALKGELIKWATREGVSAKGLGLLDEGNWSIQR